MISQISASNYLFGFQINVVDDCKYLKFRRSKYFSWYCMVITYCLPAKIKAYCTKSREFCREILKWQILVMLFLYLGYRYTRIILGSIFRSSQKSYIDNILKKLKIKRCKRGDIPIAKGDKLSQLMT